MMVDKPDVPDPPWYLMLRELFRHSIPTLPLNPQPEAWRTRRRARFDWIGEAIHPRTHEWVRLTPRCWFSWQAKQWLSYYEIGDK